MAAAPVSGTRTDRARRALLVHRVRLLVAATIAWNVVEAVVALTAGHLASSSALVALGLDSVVEVLSAAAVARQLAAPDPQARERTAMRVVALSFVGLALLVGVDAARTLSEPPSPSTPPWASPWPR